MLGTLRFAQPDYDYIWITRKEIMAIIISKNGESAKKIDKSDIEKEDYLQNYIHQNPESIPVYEIHEDKKLFVAAREFPTGSGPIDALAIDKDGDIYIVETKLYKNPDKRTVVAQALDYGAALWKHSNDFSEFINEINKKIQKNFPASFQEIIKEKFKLDDEQVNGLLEKMRGNLKDGNLKFVILMNSLDERLKDLILYVNQNSQFDIFAVELEYYKYEDYEIMIPKLFGMEVKKNITQRPASQQWNEISFLSELERCGNSQAKQLVIQILEWAQSKALPVNWGKGRTVGTFYPTISCSERECGLFGVYTTGNIEINFQNLLLSSEEQKTEMRNRLNSIPKVSLKSAQTWGSFPIAALDKQEHLKQFFDVCEWAIEQMA